MSTDPEKTDRRLVDFQILLSGKQLALAREQQGLTQKSCIQAALLQLFRALEAYLAEITARRVQNFDEFQYFKGGDFRVIQLRELLQQPGSWLNGLLTMVQSTRRVVEPKSTFADFIPEPTESIIASSVEPALHWSLMDREELEVFHAVFTGVVSTQRALAWEL